MKNKILSLVLVLSVVLSLGIAIPASAASNTSATAPALTTVYDEEVGTEVVTYDEAYVAMNGLDADCRGTATQPFRTITYAVNHLPYDANNVDDHDPMQGANPSSATVPDRINIHTGVYGFYDTSHTIAENIVVDGLHLTQAVVIRSYNWVIVNGQPQPDPLSLTAIIPLLT